MKVVAEIISFIFVTIVIFHLHTWKKAYLTESETKIMMESSSYELRALTTELLQTSASGMWPTHPYPESFALKSLSICILAVENSLYIACKHRGKFSVHNNNYTN